MSRVRGYTEFAGYNERGQAIEILYAVTESGEVYIGFSPTRHYF